MESLIEIGAVVESAGEGNFCQAAVGGADVFDGALHPFIYDILHRGLSVEAFEQGGKIGRADMGDLRQTG